MRWFIKRETFCRPAAELKERALRPAKDGGIKRETVRAKLEKDLEVPLWGVEARAYERPVPARTLEQYEEARKQSRDEWVKTEQPSRTARKERDLEDKFCAMMDLETQRLADDTRHKVMISLKLVSIAGYAEDEAADPLKAACS